MTAKRIGIFWLVGSRLIVKAVPLEQAAETDGIRDIEENHYYLWEHLRRVRLTLRPYSYDYYPRGRITYDIEKRQFHIYADACLIRDAKIMRRIRKVFGILAKESDVAGDFHYQCKRCNREYVSD